MRTTDSLSVLTAQFKLGIPSRHYGKWQPAMALGFRTSLGVQDHARFERTNVAHLYAVASGTLGPVRLHIGVGLWDSEVQRADESHALRTHRLVERVRPFVGIEWTPSIYPRTSVVGAFSWAPVIGDDTNDISVDLRWLAGWGVRYQALSWGSIELGVRHRENDRLSDTTVLLRINAVFPRR